MKKLIVLALCVLFIVALAIPTLANDSESSWDPPPTPPEQVATKGCANCGQRLLTACKRLGWLTVDGINQKVLFTACNPETGNHFSGEVAGKWTYDGSGRGWILEVIRYVKYVPDDLNGLIPEPSHLVWLHMRQIAHRTNLPQDVPRWTPCDYQVFRP